MRQTQHRCCFSSVVPRQLPTQHRHSETGKPCSCKSYKGRLHKNIKQNTGRQYRHKQKHSQTISTQQHNLKVNKTNKPKVFVELPAATCLICSWLTFPPLTANTVMCLLTCSLICKTHEQTNKKTTQNNNRGEWMEKTPNMLRRTSWLSSSSIVPEPPSTWLRRLDEQKPMMRKAGEGRRRGATNCRISGRSASGWWIQQLVIEGSGGDVAPNRWTGIFPAN